VARVTPGSRALGAFCAVILGGARNLDPNRLYKVRVRACARVREGGGWVGAANLDDSARRGILRAGQRRLGLQRWDYDPPR